MKRGAKRKSSRGRRNPADLEKPSLFCSIRYALERSKRVVPVLLDHTPLASELAPTQGIDLRGTIQHSLRPSAASAIGATATPAAGRVS